MVNITKKELKEIVNLAGVELEEDEYTTSNYVLLDGGIVYDTNFEFVTDLKSTIKEIVNKKSKLVVGIKLEAYNSYYELTELWVQRDPRVNILFYQGNTPMQTVRKKTSVVEELEREVTKRLIHLESEEDLETLCTLFRDYRELLKVSKTFLFLTENSCLYKFSAIREGQSEPTIAWTISDDENEEDFVKHLQSSTKNKEGTYELSEVKFLRKVKLF